MLDMKRYFQKVPRTENCETDEGQSSSKKSRVEFDLSTLEADPGLRPPISSYNPNDIERIRRAYIQKGPCQPRDHSFRQRMITDRMRSFQASWFNEYPSWLEYSIAKDAAFCLCCYLFPSDTSDHPGKNSFVIKGFRNWKKKSKLDIHCGKVSSSHHKAQQKCQDLMNQKQSIQTVLIKQSTEADRVYTIHLHAIVDCIRYLLRQGLAFRGADESTSSKNQGNFLELVKFLANHNEEIKRIVEDAPRNLRLISSDIQKDIVNAFATETTLTIMNELGDEQFSLLVDESRDMSTKEQMAVVLRFVDKRGCIMERFLSIMHVADTSALSLKSAIEKLFSQYNLSFSRIRGQGYDGASNMRGEFNGLKALILKENSSAHYIHCFAHQLQLTLVFVAKNHPQVGSLFTTVTKLMNTVGASCKRRTQLREKRAAELLEKVERGDLTTGRGLNQETTIRRPGETRWGSHYDLLVSLVTIFSPVIDVLEDIEQTGLSSDQKGDAHLLLNTLETFDFVFTLHLMVNVLGITDGLHKALQRREQDIENAITLVGIAKSQLQSMRDSGWNKQLDEVSSFCKNNEIFVPNMDATWVPQGRSRRRAHAVTNYHHYHTELFFTVVDMQWRELNDRFTHENTNLLLYITCLNPRHSFSSFDKQKLLKLAQFYPKDFSEADLKALDAQLETFIIDMRSDTELCELKGMGELAQTMVEKKKDLIYPLVYRLLKLTLILPIATATVERVFSAMNIIKSRLRNRLGDDWLNGILVTYIEKEISDGVDTKDIMRRFHKMANRRGHLAL